MCLLILLLTAITYPEKRLTNVTREAVERGMDSERRELENSEDKCIVCMFTALSECAGEAADYIYMCVPEDTGAADPKGLATLQQLFHCVAE